MPQVTTATPAPAASRNATPAPRASDDEILGIASPRRSNSRNADPFAIEFDADAPTNGANTSADEVDAGEDSSAAVNDSEDPHSENSSSAGEPTNLRAVFDANPELRTAWHDANAYREAFATPAEARQATALLADVNRMDALFFSQRPEDHAALARAIADLDPASFQSLARAINEHAKPAATHRETQPETRNESRQDRPANAEAGKRAPEQARESSLQNSPDGNREAQVEFLHAANASAVESVVSAIESQVERLLPEGISKSARTRVVGEIYRELDTALRSNHQLSAQMRDAFRSGSLDADHQRAIVSLITSRARQALPGVAKRVMNEWTSTLVSANRQRLSRQRTAERRVDIAGSGGAGNEGRRSMSPRDLDYSRLSDADILNL